MKERREERHARAQQMVNATKVVRIVVSRPNIDKGIAMPGKRSGERNWEYPFEDMDIGDSFAVPSSDAKNGTVNSRINLHNRAHPETKFRTRWLMDDQGEMYTRVWRTQ